MYKSYFFLEAEQAVDPFVWPADQAATEFAQRLPDVSGYTQTRTITEQISGRDEPPFVGIAELDNADLEVALNTTAQAAALQPFLAKGVRIGPIVTGHARTVMRLPAHHAGGLIKAVFPFRRKTTLEVAQFQRYWWLNHGPIAALTERAQFYLQCHPLPETYVKGTPPYDGVTELHWHSVEDARLAMASRQMKEDQGGDAENFVEAGSVVLFLAQEEWVVQC